MNNSRFYNDKSRAQRTAREQLKFIKANISALNKVDKRGTMLKAFNDFIRCKNSFTPKELSYIDSIYEATMKGLGFPSYKGIKSDFGGVKIG